MKRPPVDPFGGRPADKSRAARPLLLYEGHATLADGDLASVFRPPDPVAAVRTGFSRQKAGFRE